MQNSSNPPPPGSRPFRDAVLQARHVGAMGQIILMPKASTRWLVALSALMGVAVLLLLTLGSYTRRTAVTGQLTASAGVMRVMTPQNGVVLERRVSEGQRVQQGDVLYVISSDRQGAGERGLQADIGQQVDERKRSLASEIARNSAVEQGDISHLERRAALLRAEGQAIERKLEQQRVRLKLAEDARKRYQALADQDYVARDQLYQKEAELSEQLSRQQALQRDALVAQRELATAQREIDNTRLRSANQNAVLQRSLSSAQQELTEVEGRRRVVITAPQAGQATLVAGEVGQAVDASRALLNLVPLNAQLEARLYAPSRTIGFVRPGYAVLLRYQAFPFQKFGQYDGVVVSVSGAPVPTSEQAGLSLPDTAAGEPVFAITVQPKQQTVNAYGRSQPLQPGMRLDADILQETRRLYEWVLEPLYSITRKAQ